MSVNNFIYTPSAYVHLNYARLGLLPSLTAPINIYTSSRLTATIYYYDYYSITRVNSRPPQTSSRAIFLWPLVREDVLLYMREICKCGRVTRLRRLIVSCFGGYFL